MKKYFKKKMLLLLVLLTTITTRVQSYFIRGSIYQKNGNFIVLLGDAHAYYKEEDIGGKQRTGLINSLKLYPEESTLTLAENHNRINVSMMESLQAKKLFPLFFLVSDLKKEDLNAIDAECRSATTAYEMKTQLFAGVCFSVEQKLKTVEQYKEAIKRLVSNDSSLAFFGEVSLEDVLKEFDENIEQIKRYEKEIKEAGLDKESFILDFYAKKREGIIDSTKADIELLKKYSQITAEEYFDDYLSNHLEEKKLYESHSLSEEQREKLAIYEFLKEQHQVMSRLDSNDAISILLEINIIHNIVKNNKSKKVIVACAGLAHTVEIEKFLIDLGYQLVEDCGVEMFDKIEDIKISEIPGPISISELIKHVKIK